MEGITIGGEVRARASRASALSAGIAMPARGKGVRVAFFAGDFSTGEFQIFFVLQRSQTRSDVLN
ncbi:MAG: hypothetical protein ACT4PS_03870 [Betaproteobacteria bacterium]